MKAEVILASQCGAALGKYILVLERNAVDPNYSKKVQEGVLRTSSPIYLYSIKPILVDNVGTSLSANGVKSVVYNNDSSLRLPLAGIEDMASLIPKPTADSVRKAISKFEATGEKTIFLDYVQLTKEVTSLNTENKAILTAFVSEQMKFVKTLEDANNAEIAACKSAMSDEGIDVTGILA